MAKLTTIGISTFISLIAAETPTESTLADELPVYAARERRPAPIDPRDAEIAQLKARVAELEHEHNFIGIMFERARDVTYSSLTGEAFNREWLNRLEQLYMQTAKFHPAQDAELETGS